MDTHVWWFDLFFLCWAVGCCVGFALPVQSTPDAVHSQEKTQSSFSLFFIHPLTLRPHRCPQAPHGGQLHYAWWVCPTWSAWTREGEEIAHQFQPGGGPERGDPGGGRQEDAGETWQRQRHHLCSHGHEHGEDSISFWKDWILLFDQLFSFCRFPVFSRMAPLGQTSTSWWSACCYWKKTRWVDAQKTRQHKSWVINIISVTLFLSSSWGWPSVIMLTSRSTAFVSGSQGCWGRAVNATITPFCSLDWTSAPGKMNPVTHLVRAELNQHADGHFSVWKQTNTQRNKQAHTNARLGNDVVRCGEKGWSRNISITPCLTTTGL